MFMTPGLPFVPAIAVTVNIYLIFKLSILTLVRFTIWMTIGIHFSFVIDTFLFFENALNVFFLNSKHIYLLLLSLYYTLF